MSAQINHALSRVLPCWIIPVLARDLTLTSLVITPYAAKAIYFGERNDKRSSPKPPPATWPWAPPVIKSPLPNTEEAIEGGPGVSSTNIYDGTWMTNSSGVVAIGVDRVLAGRLAPAGTT